jgi:hypothetical protein
MGQVLSNDLNYDQDNIIKNKQSELEKAIGELKSKDKFKKIILHKSKKCEA